MAARNNVRAVAVKRLRQILFALVAVCAALLAVANRTVVTISLDPIPPASEALSYQAPLFLVILIAMLCGILLGGLAVKLGQRKSPVIAPVPPAAPFIEGHVDGPPRL